MVLLRLNLINRRKKCGYTQSEFAKLIGMTQQGYAHIESGIRFPREKTLERIMKVLKCESISIFDNDPIERGNVFKNICKYMNDLSNCRTYTTLHVSIISKCIKTEYKERKQHGIHISSKTIEGKKEIYRRAAAIAKREFDMQFNASDIELFKRCTRLEYTDRTGKCTWGIPSVREYLGYDPKTGY